MRKRRTLVAGGLAMLALGCSAPLARAAAIHVNTLNGAPTNGACALVDAITSANTDATPAGSNCVAGSGSDTIDFTVTGRIDLTTGLPSLASNVTVEGPGAKALEIRDVTAGGIIGTQSLATNITIDDLTLSNAFGAPALQLVGGTIDVHRVVVRDGRPSNQSPVVIAGTNITLSNVTLTHNVVGNSHGVVFMGVMGSSLFLRRSTISSNSNTGATTHPALEVGNGVVQIIDSTIAGNTGGAGASGILRNGGLVITQNSIVAGDGTANPVCQGGMLSAWSQGHNISTDATCNYTASGDMESTDPQLGPVQDNGGPVPTQALAPTSPAVDHGLASSASDARGEPRPFDFPGIPNGTGSDGSDIGAFELQPALTLSKAGTGSGTVTSTPGGIVCGSACAAAFTGGSTVTLTAVPDAGSSFAGFSGGGCSGTGPCVIPMNDNHAVTATFTANPPQTRIDAAKIKAKKGKAKFRFSGSGGVAPLEFQCALTRGKAAPRFKRCNSPKTYKKLKRGKYTFRVRARDASAQLDASPATKKFKSKRGA